ncbi:tyrosine-type recombinase/integrase [Adlercreutzia sp. ZJ141]|uniref:tyrosine-type recombinase/integrase n=1 Tax=Adlercreutzia sp. ZJ141 TaxID=2709406 RepID=UPI0013E9D2FC|nr:tyrosine-type recombinase/integrase [Adlercreutzia sp. ZJ141]
MTATNFQSLVSRFLLDYLPNRRGFSPNTVMAYRDAIALLLIWFESETATQAYNIGMDDLTPEAILSWAAWLENARDCCPSTCNSRIAAIKSFAKFAQYEAPDYLEQCTGIVGIPMKKHASREIDFLSPEGVGAVITAASGNLRELAILSVLYESAARVSEVAALNICDIARKKPFTAKLLGKGRKVRVVPLSAQVGDILAEYVCSYRGEAEPTSAMFLNAQGNRIGRAGIAYILKKNIAIAHEADPAVVPPTSHPHALRHSKAMHMLESGINLVYIRDFLGHKSVTTTEIYAKASVEAKRKAIEGLEQVVVKQSKYDSIERADILSWLRDLL